MMRRSTLSGQQVRTTNAHAVRHRLCRSMERLGKALDSRLLGIGGYYLVTGITHKISRDGYVTSLKCYPENVYGKTDCCGRSKDGKSKLEELRAKLAKSRHALESSLGGEDPDHAGPPGVLAPSSPGESKKAKKGKLKKAARKAAARKRAREIAAAKADYDKLLASGRVEKLTPAEVEALEAKVEFDRLVDSGRAEVVTLSPEEEAALEARVRRRERTDLLAEGSGI